MNTKRFELIDNDNPTWRGQRFSDRGRAMRALAQAVGSAGRWSIKDRQTGEVIKK